MSAMAVTCPSCGAELDLPRPGATGSNAPIECPGCERTFPTYRGIVDFREAVPPTCWTAARRIPEQALVGEMVERFESATLAELVDLYVSAYDLPAERLAGSREYFLEAEQREAWTITYMEFSTVRYASRELRGRSVLDAGCGGGGALPHLCERFGEVVGIDPDLPALLVAAKRLEQLGLEQGVTLIAGMLEQPLWREGSCDFVKCTDVIEHVADPLAAAENIATAIGDRGLAFVLTPNKWSPFTPEPHVRMWGVQFLPVRMADRYVERRLGIRYSDIARLLSYRALMRTVRTAGMAHARFIPIEDKHLNPASRRGRRIKRIFSVPPGRWASHLVRPIQPTLEVLCGDRSAGR